MSSFANNIRPYFHNTTLAKDSVLSHPVMFSGQLVEFKTDEENIANALEKYEAGGEHTKKQLQALQASLAERDADGEAHHQKLAREPLKHWDELSDSLRWRLSKKGNVDKYAPEVSSEEQIAAAIKFTGEQFNPAVVDEIKERLIQSHPKEGEVISLVFPVGTEVDTDNGVKSTSRNVLPAVHAHFLQDALQTSINESQRLKDKNITVELDESFMQLSKTNSTDAGVIGKVMRAPLFAIEGKTGNEKIAKTAIIVEDDTELAMTAVTALAFVDMNFKKSLGIVVVASSPGAVDLPMLPKTRDALLELVMESENIASKDKATDRIDNLLGEVGVSMDRLSNIATIGLVAQMLNPEKDEHKKQLNGLLGNAGISDDDMKRYAHVKGAEHQIEKAFYDTSIVIGAQRDDDKTAWQVMEDKAREAVAPGHRMLLGVGDDAQNVRRANFADRVTDVLSEGKGR